MSLGIRSCSSRPPASVPVYKQKFSRYITAPEDDRVRKQMQMEAAAVGDELAFTIKKMRGLATPHLRQRTVAALEELEASWRTLSATLALTFLSALLIAFVMTRRTTEPIERLVDAARGIRKAPSEFVSSTMNGARLDTSWTLSTR